jgi:predicted enzyme related to lactoylglutathione lyase
MSSNCLGYFTMPVADLGRGQAFYGGLFGWQFEAAPGEQRYAHIGNTTPPGGVSVGEARVPQVWFRIDDIRAAVARVRALGGTAEEPQESPSGWSSACHDDQGTQFNLWQPAPGY